MVLSDKRNDFAGLNDVVFKMVQFTGFPSIGCFKDFLGQLRKYKVENRVIRLRGTVKLHGTHGDICKNVKTGEVWCQSRNRILTVKEDNYGFAKYVSKLNTELLFDCILEKSPKVPEEEIVVAGEWCGASIQSKVALAQLPECFVMYGVKVDGEWMDSAIFKDIEIQQSRFYNVYHPSMPVYDVKLDKEDVETCRNRLIDLTAKVEDECPFGKRFGVDGLGEGIVWVMEDQPGNKSFWFKTKGDKHATSKVKTLRPRSKEELERLKQVKEFAAAAVTENRLMQALEFLHEQRMEVSLKSMAAFLKWVKDDVVKEDLDPDIPIDVPKLMKEVGFLAKRWFLERVNQCNDKKP